jgi:uncharacterized membrane protein
MKHAHFLEKIDDERILAAIVRAEEKTTGAIRLLISKRHCADPVAAAERHFRALGLNKRPEHNAVLVFVAPKSRTFAIYGDSAIHVRVGHETWSTLRDETSRYLKESRFTDAVLHAINRAGELLALHFPRGGKDAPA